jgi:hypothetical protein
MCHVPKGPAYGQETAFRRVLNLTKRRVNRICRPTHKGSSADSNILKVIPFFK